MRTKTNFMAVQALMDAYTPAQRGILQDHEADLIRKILEIDGRDDLELNDVRDMAVAMYGAAAAQKEHAEGIQAMMVMMDAMSAVTALIDQEKAARTQAGYEIKNYPVQPRYAIACNDNTEFMRPAGKPAFSPDPAEARKWPTPRDAETMAKYASAQYNMPVSVVRIETCRTVFPVRDINTEQARLNNNNNNTTGGTGDVE